VLCLIDGVFGRVELNTHDLLLIHQSSCQPAWPRMGRAPSHLGGAPSSGGGAPGVLLGPRGFLLGAPSSELGECPRMGRARVRELGVCLKLLGLCPKTTGARALELGACRELARGRGFAVGRLSQAAGCRAGACHTSRG
jgi:hypothetical protein